jgi:hypothetical protein
MQAVLENDSLPLLDSTALPLLESATLPLFESATLPLGNSAPNSAPTPSADAAPAWTIRIARPAAANRNELAQELHGVPKAALRQVFGEVMGTRLWQLNRLAPKVGATPAARISPATPEAKTIGKPQQIPESKIPGPEAPGSEVPDSEIRSGMLRYLCAEAAATLRERNRLANSISLTALYSDGRSETVRRLLLQSANAPDTLEAAARLALCAMRSDAFVSLKLDLTAAAAQA